MSRIGQLLHPNYLLYSLQDRQHGDWRVGESMQSVINTRRELWFHIYIHIIGMLLVICSTYSIGNISVHPYRKERQPSTLSPGFRRYRIVHSDSISRDT
ncbi:hypothetical protein BCR39DRAFT_554825 [Naematelia encephala]|uniref:Uncharacterized protein n=1 Tax=Naematelia encephala TaxID=71784 RepID=A0A1Y2ADW2_9TREE|nr:hypothetical protein BCR39DRAFT_554825 [Naematelia encephala]